MLLRTTLSYLYHVYYEPYSSSIAADSVHVLGRRAENEKHDATFVVFAVLIPVLVVLSGIFAGLTLGYMSLDETQLNVLNISGTLKQKEYAAKIKPIRSNGHQLLVTLLLANMIVNETLPVICDRVFGGGVPAVVGSTAMIVIFSEIIPQSLCSRYGLYIGAKCAPVVRALIWFFLPIAWPVAKLLELILGSHHGIIYRRAELKELIAMHSAVSPHGGDLKADTVTIIGHTLDLQEKVARDAMTPIERVFMLHIDARLDYETLVAVCKTGHSRIPVYDEVDFGVPGGRRVKKIIGILLVKQCVLLDPADATPVKQIPLNAVPSVPYDEPLLGILDRFQEGRSHMAIVSPIPRGKAASVKEAVKQSFTQRFMSGIGLGDDSSNDDSTTDDESGHGHGRHPLKRRAKKSPKHEKDVEKGFGTGREQKRVDEQDKKPTSIWAAAMGRELEQTMPADAVLNKESANHFLQGYRSDLDPVGIITLEDVLEELIGEEIFDEFDHSTTAPHVPASEYVPPEALREIEAAHRKAAAPGAPAPGATPKKAVVSHPAQAVMAKSSSGLNLGALPPKVAQGLSFLLPRSAPTTPRQAPAQLVPDDAMPILKLDTEFPVANGGGGELARVNEEAAAGSSNSAPASPTTTTLTVLPSETETLAPPPAPMVVVVEPLPTRVRGSSRSSSPAPGLLSLIERRRRAAAAAGTVTVTAGSGGSAPTLPGAESKTKRPGFKSTPLAPGAGGRNSASNVDEQQAPKAKDASADAVNDAAEPGAAPDSTTPADVGGERQTGAEDEGLK